mmetsp:Transcript_104124/g.335724  ORF Transcript_104124/g.335724 Transcript_104124/m.335724 type:complete len:204 (+) Transcript_104124:608-1219(+)
MASRNRSTTGAGAARRETLLSSLAVQAVSLQPRSAFHGCWNRVPGWLSCTLAMRTTQARVPSTGILEKNSGYWEALSSFQTRSPSDPDRAPMHTEKFCTLWVWSRDGLWLMANAAFNVRFATFSTSSGADMPMSKYHVTFAIASSAASHAAEMLLSGLTPTIAPKAASGGTWTWLPAPVRKLWSVSDSPMETWPRMMVLWPVC